MRREFNIAPPLWTTRAERRVSAAPLLVPPLAVGLVALGALLLVARPLDHALAPLADAPSALAADPPPTADEPREAPRMTSAHPLRGSAALWTFSSRSAFRVSARAPRPVAGRASAHDCLTAPGSRPSGPSLGQAEWRPRLSSVQAP